MHSSVISAALFIWTVFLWERIKGSEIPIVEILEEAAPGTVIMDNLQQRFRVAPEGDSKSTYVAIGNPSSPGISNLEIRTRRFDGVLQLVVKPGSYGPDREKLCNKRNIQSSFAALPCDITLVVLHGDRKSPSYAQVILRVLDINDNAPTFREGREFDIRIPEDAAHTEFDDAFVSHSPPGLTSKFYQSSVKSEIRSAEIILPTAVDADLPENGVKYYRLTSTSGQELEHSVVLLVENSTEINAASRFTSGLATVPHTPTLKVVGLLDREKQPEYWFHLLALDGGVPQRTGTLSIHLIVTDLNDNVPKFRKPIFHQPTFMSSPENYRRLEIGEVVRVPETVKVGTGLLTLVADDSDEGANAEITYRLRQSDSEDTDVTVSQLFQLNSTNDGVTLCVAKTLDADDISAGSWMDGNQEIFGHMMKVIIDAVDAGVSPLTGSITISILVENVNDNAPDLSVQYTDPIKLPAEDSLKPEIILGSLKENQPAPSVIAHLTVTDADITVRSNNPASNQLDGIKCESNDTRFGLEQLQRVSNENTEDRTGVGLGLNSQSLYFYRMTALKSLDREDAEWVHIKITCVDQYDSNYHQYSFARGNTYNQGTQLTGSIIVTIKVLDTNDNPPKFTTDVYQFSVVETPDTPLRDLELVEKLEPKVSVGTVQAFDSDVGPNGEIEYRLLSNPGEIFQIDQRSGQLWRIGSVDREKTAQFELQIEARDKGNPMLSSSCTVKIDILDVNDNPPYWVSTSPGEAYERYTLGHSEDGIFHFCVYEDARVGSVIGYIKAIDTDGNINTGVLQVPLEQMDITATMDSARLKDTKNYDQSIVYRLESVQEAQILTLNKFSGELRLRQKLDREVRAHYELRAFAVDSPSHWRSKVYGKSPSGTSYKESEWNNRFTATATIIITVLDVNDNYPQFESPLAGQEFHIDPGSTLTTPGTTLFTAKAHDADAGENATVRYALENGGYGLVEIDSTTGVCYLRETIHKSKLQKLINSEDVSISERIFRVDGDRSTSDMVQGLSVRPNELRSSSLSLKIIAYDLGQPVRLNSSRTVRLVWSSTEGSLSAFDYHKNSPLSGGRLGGRPSFGSLTGIERLLVPLVVGAFLLLFIICLILFAVLRYRRRSKSRVPDQFTIDARQGPSGQWTWCACVASQRNEKVVSASEDNLNDKRQGLGMSGVVFDGHQREGPILNKTTRKRTTSLEGHLPVSMRSYLPDCIPASDQEVAEVLQRGQLEACMPTAREMQLYDRERKQNGRYATGRFSRSFSEESLLVSRQNDLGYTSLCAYPPLTQDQARFAPIADGFDECAYPDKLQETAMLQYSPMTRRKTRTVPVNLSTLTSKPVPVRYPPASFYDPSGTTQNFDLMYPTFQTAVYGQNEDGNKGKYEEFELCQGAPATQAQMNDASLPHNGSGWKTKMADAYAENSFV
ncbi:unnamed protein product [Calicophoron daubneyi]|uniref:Cadherin domain-containing protein n=1 Tax=Calicophoron daubneyi TaxID=300641 RepID=A0AAV2TET7_CALDB